MSRLNQPLKAWQGLVAAVLTLVLGVCATAIATSAHSGAPTPRASKVLIGRSHGYSYVRRNFTNFANSVDQGVVGCGRGKVVVGGGGLSEANNSSGAQALNSSHPHDGGDRGRVPDGWAIFVDNTTDQNLEADVFAVCRKVR
jgi:hypothetical protein